MTAGHATRHNHVLDLPAAQQAAPCQATTWEGRTLLNTLTQSCSFACKLRLMITDEVTDDACCYATGCTASVTVVGGCEAWASHRPAGSDCTLLCRVPPAANACVVAQADAMQQMRRNHGIMLTDVLADIGSCLHCLGGATAQTPEIPSPTLNVLYYNTTQTET